MGIEVSEREKRTLFAGSFDESIDVMDIKNSRVYVEYGEIEAVGKTLSHGSTFIATVIYANVEDCENAKRHRDALFKRFMDHYNAEELEVHSVFVSSDPGADSESDLSLPAHM